MVRHMPLPTCVVRVQADLFRGFRAASDVRSGYLLRVATRGPRSLFPTGWALEPPWAIHAPPHTSVVTFPVVLFCTLKIRWQGLQSQEFHASFGSCLGSWGGTSAAKAWVQRDAIPWCVVHDVHDPDTVQLILSLQDCIRRFAPASVAKRRLQGKLHCVPVALKDNQDVAGACE